MADKDEHDVRKAHNKRHAGKKADKKAAKDPHVQEYTDKQRNPKAFTNKSAVNARKQFLRTQNIRHKKHHIPVVSRAPLEPPPVLIAVVGGPRSGKSSLVRSLVKLSTKQRLTSITGPVTVVSGKKRRITYFEVNNDINCMIDMGKVADIVLLLIDITIGIEMEIFEFLEICRAHGTPKVMGVLNHLDLMKENKSLRKKKTALKHRFEVELYPGAKLFYLNGMIRDEYMLHDIKNLSRFIAVSKFRPLTFRSNHPYVCVDRFEDVTNPGLISKEPKCDRDVILFGYVRGAALHSTQEVHIPGCGDFVVEDVKFLPDPCPLPDHEKKRSLHSDEHLVYAPFSGVGGVVYDKDAVYIDLGGSQHGRYIMEQQKEQQRLQQKQHNFQSSSHHHGDSDSEDADSGVSVEDGEAEDPESANIIMSGLQNIKEQDAVERRLQLFYGGAHVTAQQPSQQQQLSTGLGGLPDYESIVDGSGRVRRKALIPENQDFGSDDSDDDSDDENEKNVSGNEEEEEQRDDEGSSEDESDVDNLVPRTKEILQGEVIEPAQKKRKIEKSTSSSDAAAPQSMTAFSKIKSVLESLQEQEQSEEENDSNSDEDSLDQSQDLNISQDSSVNEANVSQSADGSQQPKELEGEAFQIAMFEEARKNFYQKQSSAQWLTEYIYGEGDNGIFKDIEHQEMQSFSQEVNNIMPFGDNDFFHPVQVQRSLYDDVDTTYWQPPDLEPWKDDSVKKSIGDCFVTGAWNENEDAETLLKLDNMDENLYGSFEDLTTGEKFDGKEGAKEGDVDDTTEIDSSKAKDSRNLRKDKIIAKKRKLKEMLLENNLDDKGDFFDSWKEDMNKQADLNRSEFENLNDETRVLYEGFRSGMYVRMRFSKMPCEFVINFDPSYPVIVGGLLDNETKNVYNRVRMKVHRWYPKILKNRDPLILSIGWRRIQTMMYYGKREDDLKLRSLKYARKYLHVEGTFWGPYTPNGSGFVGFQSVGQRVAHFRIAANGVSLEADKTTTLVKKLKLIGHPKKVSKKTAFIQDMFHSETEVAKFIGAKIQSQSGIRGLIKSNSGIKGDFRAKFEDSIKMSDVIILKTWANVDVHKYCSVVRSLLLTPSEKQRWQGMKTVGELKKERHIKSDPNPDSLYTEITKRRTHVPKPLKIPRSLQTALPYAFKPKHQAEVPELDRVLIVKDEKEEKMDRFMERARLMMKHKIEKDKAESRSKHDKFRKEKTAEERIKLANEKKRKTVACKKYSKKKVNAPK